MIEGMAVVATEIAHMNEPSLELYLNFSGDGLALQQQELAVNARQYLKLIREDAPPEEYELWFADFETQEAPARGGYLLGYEVVKRLLPLYGGIEPMIRMSPSELRHLAEQQLALVGGEQVFLLSGDRD